MRHFQAFLLQSLSQTLREENVAVDQQDPERWLRVHAGTSGDINRSKSSTSTISSLNDSSPDMYGGNLSLAGNCSASANSHSPVTGIAVRFSFPSTCRSNTR